MSITGLIAFSLLIQMGQSPEAKLPQAAPLVSKMLAKFSAAQEMVGAIVMTQSYEGHKYIVDTSVQFLKPYKLFIKQVSNRTPPEVWVASSTGTQISYDVQPHLKELVKTKRFLESQTEEHEVLKVGEVYHVVSRSIGDRSVPLDIAIGHIDDLKYIRNQWKTMSVKGTAVFNGQDVYEIVGDWRPHLTAGVRGKYAMLIDKNNELKQYSITEMFALGKSEPKPITTVWDVDLKIDAKSDPALYRIF